MRHIGLLFLSLLACGTGLTFGAGCVRYAAIEVVPSGCVNPASRACPNSGDMPDSQILELRLYQLKERVAPCKPDYALFGDGTDKDLDLLKAQLADPQRKDLVRRIEQIEASKSKPLAKLMLLPETKYMLAVAVGRRRGKNSIRLVSREQALKGKGITFYIRDTDLCLVTSCEASMEAECPQ